MLYIIFTHEMINAHLRIDLRITTFYIYFERYVNSISLPLGSDINTQTQHKV